MEGVRQNETHTAEPFVPEPSASEVEVATGKLKMYKSASVDQIPAEMIQTGGEIGDSQIHNLINLIWNKNIASPGAGVVLIHKKCDKTYCSNYQGISLLLTSQKILSNTLPCRLPPYTVKTVTDQRHQIFYFWQILEKKWEYNGTEHQLFIDFKKAYNSVRWEVIYNILIEFGITKNLVGLIKICLNETYSTVHIDKNSLDKFPVQNGLK
jgi:hypothetical protein